MRGGRYRLRIVGTCSLLARLLVLMDIARLTHIALSYFHLKNAVKNFLNEVLHAPCHLFGDRAPLLFGERLSEASYALQTEAGFRDDVRYNNAKVSELIAPLGVEKSFRGFYHLIDDLAPRFTDDGDGNLTRVQPYSASSGIITPNASYETAPIEAAYILHQDVMESQIPEPISGASGLTFDPVNYRGKFNWKNIPSVDLNPDGTIGFFRGVLASATKPIKTEFGFVVLFQRTSTTPAA